MTVEVVHSIEPLASEWDELADRTSGSPFLRPGWYAAWWRAFGVGRLELLAARRGGELTGVLAAQRRGGALRSATNAHTPEFGVLAVDRAAARELADRLFEGAPRRVALGYLDAAEPSFEELRAAAGRARYRTVEVTLQRSPYVAVEGDWRSFGRTRPGKLLSNLRRLRRRLEEQGSVTVELHDGGERLDALLRDGFAVEGSEWKDARGTAIASRPETRRFYADAARWAAARGVLRLAFLRLDGRPLAFEYGLEDGGRYFFVKGGYDRAFHRFAPGKLLVAAMLERAFEERLASFEFLGADESWKLEWTSTCRQRVRMEAFAPSPSGRTEGVVRAGLLRHGLPRARSVRAWWRQASRS